jgi:A1 cistron-splicing factor AAR2
MCEKMEYDALKLFESGAVLVIDDMQINTEFGIDYKCWRTCENFRGVKMIPPGIHFVYYSCTDKHGNVGMRNGFFHEFKLNEIVIKKWNKQTETLESLELTQEQAEHFQARKREMDKFLGAYPYEEYKQWLSLTNFLTGQILQGCVPKSGFITSEACLIGQEFVPSKTDNAQSGRRNLFQIPQSLSEAESKLPEMKENEEMTIRFTKISSDYLKGSKPSEITQHSLDLSYKLELFLQAQQQKIGGQAKSENILGELQFAFVCFLVGNVYDAFEQWKFLLNLLCNSANSIEKYAQVYVNLIGVVYFQLSQMPVDFFTDITTSQNFLAYNLHNLFENVSEICSNPSSDELKQLDEKCQQFKNYLKHKFDFDFEQELDEYAPVVCGGGGDENDS